MGHRFKSDKRLSTFARATADRSASRFHKKTELPKLSLLEMQDLWEALEEVMDKAAAKQSLEETGVSIPLGKIKEELGL